MRKFLAAYAARNRSGKIYKHDSEHVARFLDPMAREVASYMRATPAMAY